ncbi:MAG: FMN-binding protein [Spirochaetaceae bacterium]|nr:FMN-binding protein [Spirochaetaceae bacterium]
MYRWILIFIVTAVSCLLTSCFSLSREHDEARNIKIRNIDFMKLVDGSYHGIYKGGMYKWRENEVQVMIESGKVLEITLLSSKENRPPEFTEELFNRVIEEQSLQVDVISGATLTSRAFLRSIDNALIKAEQ